MTNAATVKISNLHSNSPPASRTRYLAPGLKHVTALEAELPPSLSTGRYLQNSEAASGSRAKDKRSLGMPPCREKHQNQYRIHVNMQKFEC